jgi:hypothetical protein
MKSYRKRGEKSEPNDFGFHVKNGKKNRAKFQIFHFSKSGLTEVLW